MLYCKDATQLKLPLIDIYFKLNYKTTVQVPSDDYSARQKVEFDEQ